MTACRVLLCVCFPVPANPCVSRPARPAAECYRLETTHDTISRCEFHPGTPLCQIRPVVLCHFRSTFYAALAARNPAPTGSSAGAPNPAMTACRGQCRDESKSPRYSGTYVVFCSALQLQSSVWICPLRDDFFVTFDSIVAVLFCSSGPLPRVLRVICATGQGANLPAPHRHRRSPAQR